MKSFVYSQVHKRMPCFVNFTKNTAKITLRDFIATTKFSQIKHIIPRTL